MDIQRAKELLTALADGLDPLAGEVLPSDHVCNKGDIVRALHCVLEALLRGQKKPLPANNGKPWTEKADQELCSLFDSGMTKKRALCSFRPHLRSDRFPFGAVGENSEKIAAIKMSPHRRPNPPSDAL